MAKKPSKSKSASKSKPAGKSRQAASAKAKASGDRPRVGVKAISKAKFESILARCQAVNRKVTGERDTLNSAIKLLVETDHLHPKALRRVMSEMKMEDNKLAEYLFHYDLYRKWAGLDELSTVDMFRDDRPDKEASVGAGKAAGGETTPTTGRGAPSDEKAVSGLGRGRASLKDTVDEGNRLIRETSRTLSLTDPKALPSDQAVKDIADRAGATPPAAH